MYALTNGNLYTGTQVLNHHAVMIEGATIQAIVPAQAVGPEIPQVNCQGYGVVPGFIDLQLNGCGGVMFNDAITADTLEIMHRTNLKSGTTSFLPTLITTSDGAMRAAIALVQTYREVHPHRVLGLHLEGPYLNPKRRGIHDGRYVRLPDPEMIAAIAKAGSTTVKLVTLAPEQVAPEHIRQLTTAGIRVAAGHTDATFEEALAGFAAGVSMVTHLFNAMSPWQGRQPGMVGAVFHQRDIDAGIIADGHHVHFASIQVAHQILGDRLFLVTDATPPAGTTMDAFIIGGQQVFYREGKCVSAEGTLGGSALTMIEAIANCVQHAGIPLAEALRMATLYPARAIGCQDFLGQLQPGYVANLALVTPDVTVAGVIEQGVFHSFHPGLDQALEQGLKQGSK